MTDREAFEAWWDHFTSIHDDWMYADSEALRFQAWQAATAAERERCVKKCDAIKDDYRCRYENLRATLQRPPAYLDGVSDGAGRCADAIRKG